MLETIRGNRLTCDNSPPLRCRGGYAHNVGACTTALVDGVRMTGRGGTATQVPARVQDPRRLAALRATGLISEQVFPDLDRLTRLVTWIIGVPIALVSLVEDDRQWFASAVGLPEPWAASRQTPLTHSFCQYVVDAEAPLVVVDARAVPALRNNLAIPDLGVVAYAGYPLRAPDDGVVLGTFCAADSRPRQWGPRELRVLEEFAAVATSVVAAHLAARRVATARAETARQQAFLDALLDSLDTGVAACDNDGRLVLFNRALRLMLDADADPDEAVQAWTERLRMFHLDGRPFTVGEMPLVRALAGERVRNVDLHFTRSDGRAVSVLVNAQPITSPSGVHVGAVAAALDVTERRRAQRFRDAELAVHRAFVAAADANAAAPAVLEAIATTLGWVHAELWLTADDADVLRPAATWTSPAHSVAVHVPTEIGHGYGLAGVAWDTSEPVWVPDAAAAPWPLSPQTVNRDRLHAALAVPVRGGEHAIGVLTVFAAATEQDATCVMLLAGIAAHIGEFLQRRRAEELALQLARAKDEYIALVGHELRTPLTSIAAYAELIVEADDATPLGQLRDLVTVIHRNSIQLRGIVDDLLDLAALDSGHVKLRFVPVDLVTLIRDSVTALTPAAAEQHVNLRLELPEQLIITGAEQRLRQLVDNIVSNAVKYSPDGGDVRITVTDHGDRVELVVADQGIGIPPDEREHVFRRFYRSTLARDRAIPGTGLGLALCRVVTELHHGTITLGAATTGTSVVVRLPSTPGRRPH
jgi:signal transduction histidine kinase